MKIDRAASAADLVHAAGRDGLDIAAMPAEPATLSLAGLLVRIVAVGWATVDLDRAWAELSVADPVDEPADGPRPAAGPVRDSARDSARDELLGARSRRSAHEADEIDVIDGIGLILLEPDTEGRLAAALAHRGEGPVALYLAPVGSDLAEAVERIGSAAGGLRLRTGQTALGPGAIVLGRSAAGPQVLLVAVPSAP